MNISAKVDLSGHRTSDPEWRGHQVQNGCKTVLNIKLGLRFGRVKRAACTNYNQSAHSDWVKLDWIQLVVQAQLRRHVRGRTRWTAECGGTE